MADNPEGNSIRPDSTRKMRGPEAMEAMLTGRAPQSPETPYDTDMDPTDPESLARSLGILKDSAAPEAPATGEAIFIPVTVTPSEAAPVEGEVPAVPPESTPEPTESTEGDPSAAGETEKLTDDDIALIRELGVALAGARTLEEIKESAVAFLSKPGTEGIDAYIKQVDEYVETTKGLKADKSEQWFQPIPGSIRSFLVMEEIEEARKLLDKRSAVRRHFDNRKVKSEKKDASRKEDEAYDEAWEAGQEMKSAEKAAEDKRIAEIARAKAEAEQRIRDKEVADAMDLARRAEEAKDAVLTGPDSFEDYVHEQKIKATKPLMAELLKLEETKREALRDIDELPFDLQKDLAARYAHAEGDLRKKIKEVANAAEKKAGVDRKKLVETLFTERQAIKAFMSDPEAAMYIYDPDAEMDSELASLVSGAGAIQANARREPIQIDEYDIKHKEGHPTRMQRLVYETDDPKLVMIEDWDKTSGKLKRQMLVKGDALFVPDYVNEGLSDREIKKRMKRGGATRVLSNEVYDNEAYKAAGPIGPQQVADDAGTSAESGYSGYVRNLTRAGGIGVASAKGLANPRRPKGAEKGFIAILSENLSKKVK